MTWWLWLLLALGALAVFVLLGLSLWRRARALLAELRALEKVAGPLAELAGHDPAPPVTLPGFLAGPAELAETSQRRQRNRAARRERRQQRAATAQRRWARLGLRGTR